VENKCLFFITNIDKHSEIKAVPGARACSWYEQYSDR